MFNLPSILPTTTFDKAKINLFSSFFRGCKCSSFKMMQALLSTSSNFINTTLNTTKSATVAPVRVNWYYSARFWVSFGVAGSILNVFEAVFIYSKRKHRTGFGLTLASLCAADFLGGLCFLIAGALRLAEYLGPLTVEIIPNTSFSSSWQAGHAALFFSVGTSFIHILIIALQRLFAVVSPILFKVWFTRKRCAFILIATWLVLFLSGIVGYFFVQGIWTVSYYLMLVVGICLIICYTLICLKSWRDARKRQLMMPSIEQKSDVEKTVSISLAITIAFLVCTCPQAVFYLYINDDQDLTLYHIVNCVISANPCLDSVIYFAFYHDCSRKEGNKQDNTYTTPITKRKPIVSKQETLPLTTRFGSQEQFRGSVPSVSI